MLSPCLGSLEPASAAGGRGRHGLLPSRLGGLEDPEGASLPEALPPVVDAHVHLFPDPMFRALWRWFDAHAWPVRYRLKTPAVLEFLLSRGVEHVVALHYAHEPGLARGLNQYMAAIVAQHPQVTGVATVLPGEPDAAAILEEAFALGLHGVKLHCHVQCFAPDDPSMAEVYDTCVAHDKPLVMHAGREPASPAYRCDPHALCAVSRVEEVLRGWPRLRLAVPHLGADEFAGYRRLLEQYDNLWLDTTMVIGGFFPGEVRWDLVAARPERMMYGTDFPNLPYAWDREVLRLARGVPDEALAPILATTASELFGLELV